MKIPKTLQSKIWSVNIDKLDEKKDAALIVHKVLSYGYLDDLKWLLKTYSRENLRKVFVDKPINIYTKPAFNFAKTYILKLKGNINPKRYVKALY